MLVRVTVDYARGNVTVPAGAVLDLDMFEAGRLIEDGLAVPAFDTHAKEVR